MIEPTSSSASQERDPSLHKVVMDDLRQTRWGRDYLGQLETLYYFYLDDERRAELDRMGRIRRAFSVLFWILKSLLMKLSPARRVMLLIALVCGIAGWNAVEVGSYVLDFDLRPWGFALLLIVLMLELRDKLLARDEIAVARQVQLALLPNRHPQVPGWSVWSLSRPANDVGGDLVDYIELDGFRHAVVLGDVAGKGLGAALLTAKLQATLRAVVPSAASLDDLGSRVNDIFFRDGLDNRFATLFFVELQHDSGHVRYLNAGHNPPFVIRSSGVEKLHASSYPLGILASATYEEGALDLEPGDVIVAYSDGLTEACNDTGEEFGMQRLEALLPGLRDLPPEDIGLTILQHVDRFLGDARLTDDLSLAVIKRGQT
jgi:sigma-B regulation protein RsbU (phosphoserine phosphatase)